MEDIFEDVFTALLRGLSLVVRTVAWFLLRSCESVGWYIGWPILRTITFGQFPKMDYLRAKD